MRKYGESKTTRIMMATVPHVTSGLGLRKFQAGRWIFVDTSVLSTLDCPCELYACLVQKVRMLKPANIMVVT